MEDDILSKFVAAFLSLILLILVPLFLLQLFNEKQIQTKVDTLTSTFAKEVRNRGFLDRELYDKFNLQLASTGRTYVVKMKHNQTLHYPINASHPQYKPDKKFITNQREFSERQMLESIYNKKDIYKMNKGDEFAVTVSEPPGSLRGYKSIASMIVKDTKKLPGIFSNFGGVVDNELPKQ